MLPAFDEPQAFLIKRDYLCSRYWGDLVINLAPDRKYFVECFRCGNETPGYVTKSWAEKRRSESISEGIEVNQLLRELNLIPNPFESKTAEELIRELGF
jgi:hypothetical protein